MLVSLKEIIDIAEKGNFAIPAFNVYNTETVMGVVKAAEELRAPIIMQVYPRLLNEEVVTIFAPQLLQLQEKQLFPYVSILTTVLQSRKFRRHFVGVQQA